MTEQEISDIKIALLQGFNVAFENCVNILKKLSIDPKLQSHAFMNLDQGAFWARHAILSMPLALNQPTPPAVEAPKPEETKTEVTPDVAA